MQQTPQRTNLFTDTLIRRKIYLQYTEDGAPALRELTGSALDPVTVDILNDPTTNASIIVKFSPDDQHRAPLIFEYFIKKFLITDYHQHERALEVRIEPWPKPQPTAPRRGTLPTKVFSHGYVTVFAQANVRLITVNDGKTSSYQISSSVKLDQLTGVINL